MEDPTTLLLSAGKGLFTREGTPTLPGMTNGGVIVSPREGEVNTPDTGSWTVGAAGEPETTVAGGLATAATGVTETGLEATADTAEEETLTEATTGGGSTELPVAAGRTLDNVPISEYDSGAAAFSACSRANCTMF